jgi:hypothetical protein
LWASANCGGDKIQKHNGSHLQRRLQAITWLEAKAAAETSTIFYDGQYWQGHLATLNSAQENAYVSTPEFLGDSYGLYGDILWIGGYQVPDSGEPLGIWAWVTGEPWIYTNWASDQPDNYYGNSNYLRMRSGWFNNPGTWDDSPNNQTTPATFSEAYIIEYEPVPEPSTFVLLGLGALGLAFYGLRRKGMKDEG